MVRNSLPLVAVALAVSVVGCTHCDTCDDFPTPCVSQNTYAPGAPGAYVAAPAGEVAPMVKAPAAPAPTGPPTSGAFTPNSPASANSAVRAQPLPSTNSTPPAPTSLGDSPKG